MKRWFCIKFYSIIYVIKKIIIVTIKSVSYGFIFHNIETKKKKSKVLDIKVYNKQNLFYT